MVSTECGAVEWAQSVVASGVLGCEVVASRWTVNASIFSRDMLADGAAEGVRTWSVFDVSESGAVATS